MGPTEVWPGDAPLVGVLGAGQLGRMLALAGYPLGVRFRFLDPGEDTPAGQVAQHIQGSYTGEADLDRFSRDLSVVTYEFENVPVETATRLQATVPVYPPPAALRAAQDRLVEKSFFQQLGIPTPPFRGIDSLESLQEAVGQLGLPTVLKTRRMGYDGKGQFVLRDMKDSGSAWEQVGGESLILEGFVQFDRELSIIAARGQSGEVVFYPLVENHHREGILRRSVSPAPDVEGGLQAAAEEYARSAMEKLDYVGVLAIELFQVGDNLLVNEMAPRVHNSGHLTTEGNETSQFENHIRAILGLPLGSTRPVGYSVMLNIIGALPTGEQAAQLLQIPGGHLHLYGKSPRKGRKLGHFVIRAATRQAAEESANRAASLIGGE